ncbi:LytR family transcriptional regulator [Rhodococcus jostii RHA1] [Mycobacterium shimoidei]|uniref:LytR family transcriptional regulator [Rhodococcus jostii RHA1] n=1 Tax=Mycobacterium shimoidei TaxID=29313 RepID=A0A375YVT6_MYCSH|nr:LCP family protein [Mycobacterium shimoidei]SRX92957.1 LytR family transcriptional regulator [Rhodococcus jostii RHA1] [Mycobacterium shimoidei]
MSDDLSFGEPSPVIRRPTDPPRQRPQPPAPRPVVRQPPARPSKPRRRRKRAWGQVISLTLVIVVLLMTAGILGGTLWMDTALHRQPVLSDYPGRPAAGRGTTWLLVGSDSRQGLTAQQQETLSTGADIGDGRTDTILLVHVPAFGSDTPTTMVSIPRDSYVPIPGYGRDKINAAFTMGGARLLAQTVEQATGLRLDHYVEIGFSGFAAVVDALGGVTACPTASIQDPLAGIDLPAGCQSFDGRSALGYVRSRATPRADLDRMANQRAFMSALLHRAASPAVWLNPWRWYAVPRAVADALTVDAGDHAWDLVRLGWSLHGSTTALTVPIGEFSGSDSGSVVVWDHDAAARLFDALAADQPPPAA